MALVLLERPEDHIALLRMNRPDAMNALSTAVREELSDHFELEMIAQFFANGRAQCIHCVWAVHAQQRNVIFRSFQQDQGHGHLLPFVDIISQSTASVPSGPANTGFRSNSTTSGFSTAKSDRAHRVSINARLSTAG